MICFINFASPPSLLFFDELVRVFAEEGFLNVAVYQRLSVYMSTILSRMLMHTAFWYPYWYTLTHQTGYDTLSEADENVWVFEVGKDSFASEV